ncbi:MAG: MFS transporter [Halieaceae bacterium]|nr:MFS transporter [Halieaceae bacterium]
MSKAGAGEPSQAGQAGDERQGNGAPGGEDPAVRAGRAAPPPPRGRLLILIAALVATAIGQSLVFAILAPLGREVGLVEVQITSIIALSALVFAIASPFWGRRSDRAGRKPIILIGLIGYTVGTVLFTSVFLAGLSGLLSGLALYLVAMVARCSQSLIMSATMPATTAYAADITSPAERTSAMARLGTANSLGMILGPAVAGALATLGLLAPLYFAGALAAAAALLVWRALPALPAAQRRSQLRPRRLRYLDPRIRRFVLTAIALFTGFSAIQQTLGFQLQDRLDLDGVRTAQYTGVALMVSAIFTFGIQMTVMQRLKLPPRVFVRTGLASLGLGSLLVATYNGFTVLAIAMALLGAGIGLCMPAITAGASLAVGPEEQGGAAGVISACPAVGFVAGPVIGGLLYPLAPSGPALFSVAMMVATIGLLMGTAQR